MKTDTADPLYAWATYWSEVGRSMGLAFRRMGDYTRAMAENLRRILSDPEVQRGLERAREQRHALRPVRQAVRQAHLVPGQIRGDLSLLPMETRFYVRARLNTSLGLWTGQDLAWATQGVRERRFQMDLSPEDVERLCQALEVGYTQGLADRLRHADRATFVGVAEQESAYREEAMDRSA